MGRDSLATAIFGQRVFARYASAVERTDFRARVESFDLREHDGGAEFVGSYLSKSTYDVASRIGYEVASGAQTKDARSESNLMPFKVLSRCAEDLDTRLFDIRTPRHWEAIELDDSLGILNLDSVELTALTSPGLWKLWHEWEQASKGKRQVWSRVAAAESERQEVWAELLQARGEVEDDEEVAKTELQGERLGKIPRDAWYGKLVWRLSWLVGALESAESGGAAHLLGYLGSRRIRYCPPMIPAMRADSCVTHISVIATPLR